MNLFLEAIKQDDLSTIGQVIDSGSFDLDAQYLTDFIERPMLTVVEYAAVSKAHKGSEVRKKTIGILIESGADIGIGSPLLCCRSEELVQYLIDIGADIDGTDDNFENGVTTPLILSIRETNVSVSTVLIEGGADIDVEDENENPLIHIALDYVIDASKGVDPSREEGASEIIELLVKEGSDINAEDQYGYSPVLRIVFWVSAIRILSTKLLNIFFEYDADFTVRDPNEAPLISLAMRSRKFREKPFEILSRMFSRGADLSLIDYDINGDTTLFEHLRGPVVEGSHWLTSDDQELAALLVARGADVNHRNNNGNTPLHLIVGLLSGVISEDYPYPGTPSGDQRRVYVAIIRDLLAAGADVNQKNRFGNSPLRNAKEGGSKSRDVYRLLKKYDDERSTSGEREESQATITLASSTTFDPKANRLRASALDLYKKANEKYRSIKPKSENNKNGRTQEYIKINESRRSTRTQARYFERYIKYSEFNGPKAPKAAVPGRGRHEYGVAMDIFRLLDEDNYRDALTSSGWRQTVLPKEPWHYVATSISDWNLIEKYRSDAAPLSQEFSEKTKGFFRAEIEEKERRDDFQKSKRNFQETDRNYKQEVAKYRSLTQKLKSLEERRRRLESRRDSLIDQKQSTERQLANSRYRSCPNGLSYEECGHDELKQDYRNDVQSLRDLIDRLDQRVNEVDRQIKELEDDGSIRRKINQKRRTISDLKKKRSEVRKTALEKRKLWSEESKKKAKIQKEKDSTLDKIVELTSGK